MSTNKCLAQEDITDLLNQLTTSLIWADKYGLSEGICNHFSIATVLSNKPGFFINPQGLHWSQISRDSLVFCPLDSNIIPGVETTAFNLHNQIHRSKPWAKAVFHVHSPFASTLASSTYTKLDMCSQNALRFYNRISYYDNYGGLFTTQDEVQKLLNSITKTGIVMLSNHGIISIGNNAAEAFEDLYYFERACQLQLNILSSNMKAKPIADDVIKLTAQQFEDERYSSASLFLKTLQSMLSL